ncbi:MAG TPA: ABC transporter ATP-binding protein [Methanospirillum sp.]|uniref:ABC transporter ATP-binding protein n=1 Tax=Methanospirillum sp. TaxID=45200 RepID=UPI002BA0B242|nr:ABC transporter ATP-binding protein [Methanospirillum sp.]HWQ62815.1 ABC transporter ATP-binding protein [Methanospirillum sp.]
MVSDDLTGAGIMTISNFRRLYEVFHGYERWFLFSILLNIVVAGGTLAIPALSADLINNGIMKNNFSYSLDVGILMLLAAVIAGACQIGNAAIAVWASEYSAHTLRTREFEKIQTLSFGNIDRFRSSDLLVRLTTDVQNIKVAIQQSVMNLMQAPLLLIGTVLIMAAMAPALVWIMVVLLVLLTVLLVVYFVIVEPAFSRKQAEIDSVNKALRETLTGIRVVKAFVRQEYEITKFGQAAERLKHAAVRPQMVMSYLMPTVFAIAILGFGAVYYFGGMQVLEGTGLMIGDVTSAAQYILILMMPLLIIAIVLPFITQANASLKRIFEVLDAVPEVSEPENPAVISIDQVKGRVEFENVTFAYRNADGEPEGEVLTGINLVAKPGETIGFLGATGCGKSSLVSLIPRFYDVTGGRITIDGVDVRSISLETLRSMVSVCLQESVLFSGAISETIRFGKPSMTDDEMFVAARSADVDGFVQNIPELYDGKVARRGSNFSGGQRQRLSIARALAQKPKILILDDSTSACDVATEARIQDAITDMMAGTTKFIVAQRISSVITADRIVLMNQGTIEATGTHAELLSSSPLYQEIYESQLGSGLQSGRNAS